MGAQLRRAGEQSLKEDIHSIILEWKQHIHRASLIFVSCPKTMKTTLFAPDTADILSREDARIHKIPFDIGRPTYESVNVVHEVLLMTEIRETPAFEEEKTELPSTEQETAKAEVVVTSNDEEAEKRVAIPLTPLHEAARDGKLAILLDLLSEKLDSVVDQAAGPDFMTPLHFAAASTSQTDPVTSAACVSSLLIQGRADPCALDARLRLPYFLASDEKVREAFRMARAVLGEGYCGWDNAKVGPPLTEEEILLKKEKEAEKKRRKKGRQKEKKTKERAQAEEMERCRHEEEERQKRAEDAKRVRDSLQPKLLKKANVCDFCQIECKGKRRQQMYERLDYVYCSTDCVQKHKRELMAAAALSRFGS
jgi:hypothetical protein